MRASETRDAFVVAAAESGRWRNNNNNNRNRNCKRASSRSSWLVVDAEMLGAAAAAAAAVVVCFSFSNVLFPDEGERSCRRPWTKLSPSVQVAVVKSTSHVDGGLGMNYPSPACLVADRLCSLLLMLRGFVLFPTELTALQHVHAASILRPPMMRSFCRCIRWVYKMRLMRRVWAAVWLRHIYYQPLNGTLWSELICGAARVSIVLKSFEIRRTDVLTWTVDVQRLNRLKCFDVVAFVWLENSEKW